MKLASEFLSIIQQRGMIKQATDLEQLDQLMAKQKISAYIGFDCTAPSLHAGSMLQLMVLYWLQKTGHRPIVLLGSATTKVGDPSGKDELRKMLTNEEIAANKAGIKQAFNFLDFANGKALFLDNLSWCENLNYINFLRDYGRYFSINTMMNLDSVKARLQRHQHLSFLEFNYAILQGYDFYYLAKHYDCRLQIGGSDQWGNIVNGIDLLNRKKATSGPAFGLTTPLLTQENGKKMGKTAAGAVWLNSDLLSAYDFWQFWRNTPDSKVAEYLRLFTVLPLAEIDQLDQFQGTKINQAKKILANQVTAFCHGVEAAQEAAQLAENVFEQNLLDENLVSQKLTAAELAAGKPLTQILVELDFATSKSDARRKIKGAAIKINGLLVTDELTMISQTSFSADQPLKISCGKKRHALLLTS